MAGDLDMELYGFKSRPSSLLHSIFMYTVNMAAKTLVSVAQNSRAGNIDKWRTRDHLRFMVMLMTWLTVWILRVLMDHFPMIRSSSYYHLGGFSTVGLLDCLSFSSSSSSLSLPSSGFSSLDLVLYEGFDGPSVKALGRALTHILGLVNEIPATSSKYQFAMTMADRIMHGNARDNHVELLEVNRSALSSAFARTSSLLHRSLQSKEDNGVTRTLKALPFGSYMAPYLKGLGFCVNAVLSPWVNNGSSWRREVGGEVDSPVLAEKLAQELLWITNKLRVYGGVQHALVQWSFSSGLASLSLTANPRVQGLLLNISAILFGDLYRENNKVPSEVKFRLLVLWLPLLSHANNGVAYPVLTSFEKMEIEREMDEVISTLPAMDQEIILTNWLQDFTVSTSEWPNLQISYDRWCQSARQVVKQ